MTTAWEIKVTGRQYREAVEQDRGTEPPYSDGRSNPSPTKPHKRVAVMQPYFFPYAGYFRTLLRGR